MKSLIPPLCFMILLTFGNGEEERNPAPKGSKHLSHGVGGAAVNLDEFEIIPGTEYEVNSGKRRDKRQQYCLGLKVFDATIVVESNIDGSNPRAIGGTVYTCSDIDIDVEPVKTENEAIDIIADPYTSSDVSEDNNDIYKAWYYDNNQFYLTFIMHIAGDGNDVDDINDDWSWFGIVDGNSGDILMKVDTIEQLTVNDIGGNPKIGQRSYTFQLDADYKLENSKVWVTDNRVNWGVSITCTSTGNCYADQVNDGYGPASDCFNAGNIVVDMYNDWAWGKTPINPVWMPIQIISHLDMENAYYSAGKLKIGDGGSTFYPLTSIDIMAHEAGHGFTDYNSGLIYAGESGGMNEAYSDIAGEAAENYERGWNSWLCGEDIMKPGTAYGAALRYMYNPSKDGNSKNKWYDGISGVDVHYSSGVYNKVYYLLSAYGWTTRRIFEVATKANEIYWSAGSTMSQGACGMIDAAIDLYGENQEYIYDLRTAFKVANVECPDLYVVLEEENIAINTAGGVLYYSYNNEDDRSIKFSISGSNGDADLYVRFGANPTLTEYDCRPYMGGSNEICGPYKPSQIGTYYVMISAHATFTGLQLDIEKPPISIDSCQDSPQTSDMTNWETDTINAWRINADGTWTSSSNNGWRRTTINFEDDFDHNGHACNYDDYITITTRAKGSWPNYADRYRLTASFQNNGGTQVAYYDTQDVYLNSDWQEYSFTYKNIFGAATKVVVTEYGDDAEWWSGHYGAILSPPVINIPISCSFSPRDIVDEDAWSTTSGGNGWLITRNVNHEWISSYNQCSRSITIQLDQYCALQAQFIKVINTVKGSWPNYDDIYQTVVEFKNSGGTTLTQSQSPSGWTAKSYWWSWVSHYDNSNGQVTQIKITEYGDDAEQRAGHYGTILRLPIIRISDRDDTAYDPNAAAHTVPDNKINTKPITEIKTHQDYDHSKPDIGYKPPVDPQNDPRHLDILNNDDYNNKNLFSNTIYSLSLINKNLVYLFYSIVGLLCFVMVYYLSQFCKVKKHAKYSRVPVRFDSDIQMKVIN